MRHIAGEAVTATAVECSVVGRGAIYDVAVTRDADGQLLAELRAHSRRLTAPSEQQRLTTCGDRVAGRR